LLYRLIRIFIIFSWSLDIIIDSWWQITILIKVNSDVNFFFGFFFMILINQLLRLFIIRKAVVLNAHQIIIFLYPLISSIFIDIHLLTFLIVFQHVIKPNVNIGFIHSVLADGTAPLSRRRMSHDESHQTNTGEVFAVLASYWHFYSISRIRTYQVDLITCDLNICIIEL